jgi:hypothetical protein
MATIVTPSAADALVPGSRSAVSWASIFAGAIVAIATTLILLALGSGLGMAATSPWPGAGATATSFAIGAGIWLIVTQWLSAALGGYITGRLRTRWTGVHTDEVMFRDTAHGLLAWAVSTVIIAGVALAATASTVNAVSSTTTAAGYASDTMLRSDRAGISVATRAELGRLLTKPGPMTADDRAYVVRVVARETGVTPAEAERRIEAANLSMREAADTARKATSAIGFFTALSLLIGGFIASVAAAYGGKLRDDDEVRFAQP